MPSTLDVEHIPATSHTGPLGSTFYTLQADRETVVRLAQIDWSSQFRRVCLDPARGVISLMSPSWRHEDYGKLLDEVIEGASEVLGKYSKGLRSTRFRGRGDPPGTGLEPDCSFLIGESVARFLEAIEQDLDAGDDFLLQTPPDLVVEVELTHFDAGKPERYGQLGVRELWKMQAVRGKREVNFDFLALAPNEAPEPLAASRVLPGLTPAQVREAVAAAARARTRSERTKAVADVIVGRGAVRIKEEQEDYGSTQSPARVTAGI